MLKIINKISLIFGFIIILITAAGAGGPWIPAESAVNPVYGTLYVINNGAVNSKTGATIECYAYANGSWTKDQESPIRLPDGDPNDENSFGAKCYGLAVSPDGKQLFVSVNQKSNSRLRVYDLANGLPAGGATPTFTPVAWNADADSSPMGICVNSYGTRVYMADPGNQTLRGFFYDLNLQAWTYASTLSKTDPNFSNIFDAAAATGYEQQSHKNYDTVYISEKLNPGRIFYLLYYYSGSGNSRYSSPGTLIQAAANLKFPTYLRTRTVPSAASSAVDAALNGTDAIDACEVEYVNQVKTISSLVNSAWGWTALDTAKSGYLLFKTALDEQEASNNLYSIAFTSIKNGSTATLAKAGVSACDGLAIATDRKAVALTNSRDGSVQFWDNRQDQIFPSGKPPDPPTDLKAFTLDGSAPLPSWINCDYGKKYRGSDPEYDPQNNPNYLTRKFWVQFAAADPDNDPIRFVRVGLHPASGGKELLSWVETYEASEFTPSGSRIKLTFPKTSRKLPEGYWDGAVQTSDDGINWSGSSWFSAYFNPPYLRVDQTPPSITFRDPANNATDVPVNKEISLEVTDKNFDYFSDFTFTCRDDKAGIEYKELAAAPNFIDNKIYIVFKHQNGSAFNPGTPYVMTINSLADEAENDILCLGAEKPTLNFTTGNPSGDSPPAGLEQYNYAGDKKLSQLSPPTYVNKAYYAEHGTTRIKIKFTAQNVSGIKMVRVYKNPSSENIITTYYAGDFLTDTDQNTVTINFQKDSEIPFGDQKIKWGIQISYYDNGSNFIPESGPVLYNENSTVDYTIDRISPSITSFDPADGEEKIALTRSVTIEFSEAVNTKEGFAFTCVNEAGDPYPYLTKKDWSIDNKSVTLSHEGGQFLPNTNYTLTVTKAYDEAGNPLTGTLIKATFKTVSDDFIPPSMIKDFSASDELDRASRLEWANPPEGDLGEIRVLRSEAGWPAINSSGQPVSPAVEVYRDAAAKPGKIESCLDQGLVNGKTYYYAAYSRDIYDNWNTTLDYTLPEVNADSAIPDLLPAPKIDSVAPAEVYVGQTIVIRGSALGRPNSNDRITIGGALGKPTSWTMEQIVLAVPSFEGYGTTAVKVVNGSGCSDTFYINVKPGGIVLDDFEGGCVGTDPNAGYYYFANGSIILGRTAAASYEGTLGMEISYSPSSAKWGEWGGTLANTFNLSSMDNFKLYLKGDGSENTARLELKTRKTSPSGKEVTLFSEEFPLVNNDAWQMKILSFNNFQAKDTDGSSLPPNPDYWKNIYAYGITYEGKSGNILPHQIDFIQAFNSKKTGPNIDQVSPEAAYLGQTIIITGSQFGEIYNRTANKITIGGLDVNPAYWDDKKIITAVPRALMEGPAYVVVTNSAGYPSSPFSIRVQSEKTVIDDFDGGDVANWQFDYDGNGLPDDSGYFVADKYDPKDAPPKPTTSYPDSWPSIKHAAEGKLSREIWYSFGSRKNEQYYAGEENDWGGGWGGKLANRIDLSLPNLFKFYALWDGSQNDLNLTFKDIDGTVVRARIPNPALRLRCSQQFGPVAIPKSAFSIDYNYPGGDHEFNWGYVVSYNFIYDTKFTSYRYNYHYIDDLHALWESVELSNPSIQREEDLNQSVTVKWQINPPDKAVDIYTLSGDFTTEAGRWSPEFLGVTGNIQKDQGEVGSGKAKYYKVVPADSVFSNHLLTSEVLGKFDWEVVEGNNFVSIPLIPSGSTMTDIIGNQINPAQDKESADVIYYYNASNNQWMDAWRRIESNYLVWDGDMSSMEADRGYFVTIKPGSKAKNISVVGKLFLGDSRPMNLHKFSNMIGSAFPYKVDLNNSGLASVLTASTLPVEADKIYYYDAKIQKWQVAYLDSSGKFLSQKLNYLEPGKGYYINNQDAANPETWTYTRP